MRIIVNPSSLYSAGQEMSEVIAAVQAAGTYANSTTLNGAFSAIDGLSGLAICHGTVLHGGMGSAVSILQVLMELLEWAKDNLHFNSHLFTSQDLAHQTALELGGLVTEQQLHSQPKPPGHFGNFSFPMPVASRPVSVDLLAMDLAATHNAQALEAAGVWQSLSTQALEIAAQLGLVAANVQTNNDGLWVPNLVATITQFAANAEFFAVNALEMSRATTTLASLAPAFLPAVSGAQLALAAITEPVERRAAEEAFLTQFHALFNATLPSAMPSIRNLMLDSESGMAQEGNIGVQPMNLHSMPVPHELQTAARAVQQAAEQVVGQMAQIAPDQVVSHAAQVLPNAAPHLGAVGASMAKVATSNLVTGPIDWGMRNGFPSGGLPTVGTGMSLNTIEAGTGTSGSVSKPGAARMSIGGGMGIDASHTTTPIGALGGVNGGGTTEPVITPAQGLESGRAAAAPMTGGMPLTGGNGQSERGMLRRPPNRIKTLTSMFERDLNTRELLGEGPKVVPGVIGAWVRDPQISAR